MLKLELNKKTYHIPENADELTMDKFDKISTLIMANESDVLTKNTVIDITCIMTSLEKDTLMNQPREFFNYLVNRTNWVYTLKSDGFPLCDFIEIDGEKYSYEKSDDISLREWVDIDTILKQFPQEDKNAAILCVRVRKIQPDLSIEKYQTEFIEERLNKFKSLPVSKVFPLLNFFLSSEKQSQLNTKFYSLTLAQALTNQYRLKNWGQSTDGGQRLSSWRKKIYWTWMKFLTNELEKHVHYSHTLSTKEKRNQQQ